MDDERVNAQNILAHQTLQLSTEAFACNGTCSALPAFSGLRLGEIPPFVVKGVQAETSTASAHPRLEAFPLSCEQMTCDQAGKMAY